MRAVYWLETYLQDWPGTYLCICCNSMHQNLICNLGTIVTVSHDRQFLNGVCTDTIHLHSRRLGNTT